MLPLQACITNILIQPDYKWHTALAKKQRQDFIFIFLNVKMYLGWLMVLVWIYMFILFIHILERIVRISIHHELINHLFLSSIMNCV